MATIPDKSETKAPAALDIALDDWAASKSRRLGRRIEALSAFHRRCQRVGLGRATEAAFDNAFDNFLNQPAGDQS